jgi:hypothetical protein
MIHIIVRGVISRKPYFLSVWPGRELPVRLVADAVVYCSQNNVTLRSGDFIHFITPPKHGGLILQRAFWENKLKTLLEKQRDRFTAVYNHVQRLFEAKWEHRFALISKLVACKYQLAH